VFCNDFHYDSFGDHLQTCEVVSAASEVYGWVVYRLVDILGSVGHRVKIHKITSVTGKERGDLEIKDYVVLQNPREQDDRHGVPESDGVLRVVVRRKILHYHQLYINRPDPVAFIPVAVDTSCRIYDDFSRLSFLHTQRGSVGLILAKVSTMRISIPFDLSSRSFIPLPCFIRSRRPTTILAPYLVFCSLCSS
jgi:hypothetical protein